MKRYISLFIMVIICFLLQTTIFKHFKLANVSPNFLVVLTAAAGIMFGRRVGMFTGFLSGFLIDFMYCDVIGINILIFVLIAYLNGTANRIYYKDDLSMPLFFIGISDLIYGVLYFFFYFLLKGRLNFLFYLQCVILPGLIYTLLVSIIIYKFMHWLDEKLYPPVEIPLEQGSKGGYENI